MILVLCFIAVLLAYYAMMKARYVKRVVVYAQSPPLNFELGTKADLRVAPGVVFNSMLLTKITVTPVRCGQFDRGYGCPCSVKPHFELEAKFRTSLDLMWYSDERP